MMKLIVAVLLTLFTLTKARSITHPNLEDILFEDDVDHCKDKNGGCHQVCERMENGVSCSCHDGFSLQPDGMSCVKASKDEVKAAVEFADDVDHCKDKNGGCHQVCERMENGVSCSCNDGFSLQADGMSCVKESKDEVKAAVEFADDVDHCKDKNGGCHQVCERMENGVSCSCHDGFSLQADGMSCVKESKDEVKAAVEFADDVDHCKDKNGGCHQVCERMENGVSCSCHDGFLLQADGMSCAKESKDEVMAAAKSADDDVSYDPRSGCRNGYERDLSTGMCKKVEGQESGGCRSGFVRNTNNGVCERA